MSKLVLFDIDGSLADLNHRLHYIKNKPKNWKMFFLGMSEDKVISPTAFILEALIRGQESVLSDRENDEEGFWDFWVMFVSGRPDNYREITKKWIKDNLGISTYENNLRMRKAGDYRDDTIVKEEILDQLLLEGHEIVCVFEDRKRVIEGCWRKRGIFVFDVNQSGLDY